MICPNCGKLNVVTAKFCEECGTALNDTENVYGADKEQKSKSEETMGTKDWLMIVGGCCVGLFLVMMLVGFLVPEIETNTYENAYVTFQYPRDWTIINETPNLVVFDTLLYQNVAVKVYRTVDSPGYYKIFETIPETHTIGNTTYKWLEYDFNGDVYSYFVRSKGKDLNIIGLPEDESGIKIILETLKFK